MKKVYFGECTAYGTTVKVQELGGKCTHLPTYRNLKDDGADRFAWGAGDRQCSQLAFALVMHATQDRELAECLYPEITRRIVALFPPKRWAISDEDLVAQILLVKSLLVGYPE